MQFLTVAAITGLFASAMALPASSKNNVVPAGYHWKVINWEAGCDRAGCYSNFNITGKLKSPYPGFLAYCHVYDSGFLQPCEILEGETTSGIPEISANLKNYPIEGQNSVAALSASLKFTNADTMVTYNYTGFHNATFNQFVAPEYNFTVTPTQATAVL